MAPLTRKTDVLAVVAAGGKIQPGERPGLLRLLDSAGHEVRAWQTAIKSAAKDLGTPKGGSGEWEFS